MFGANSMTTFQIDFDGQNTDDTPLVLENLSVGEFVPSLDASDGLVGTLRIGGKFEDYHQDLNHFYIAGYASNGDGTRFGFNKLIYPRDLDNNGSFSVEVPVQRNSDGLITSFEEIVFTKVFAVDESGNLSEFEGIYGSDVSDLQIQNRQETQGFNLENGIDIIPGEYFTFDINNHVFEHAFQYQSLIEVWGDDLDWLSISTDGILSGQVPIDFNSSGVRVLAGEEMGNKSF